MYLLMLSLLVNVWLESMKKSRMRECNPARDDRKTRGFLGWMRVGLRNQSFSVPEQENE